jgi:hypothetical protein
MAATASKGRVAVVLTQAAPWPLRSRQRMRVRQAFVALIGRRSAYRLRVSKRMVAFYVGPHLRVLSS